MISNAHHKSIVTVYILFPFLILILPQVGQSRPSNSYTIDGTELVVVEEVVRCTRQDLHELCQNVTDRKWNEQQQQQQQQQQQRTINSDNESAMDIMDDLILLENKPKQQQIQQQQRDTNPYGTYQQQSEMLTSAAAREDTLVSAAAAAPAVGDPSDSTAYGSSYRQVPFDSDNSDNSDANDDANDAANTKTTDVDAVNAAAADEIIADGVLFHGVLLRLADGTHSIPQPLPSIDMSDFVSLIPAKEVKSIATNYYNNDAEVRRAYAYLSGRDFIELRQQIIESPEVGAFLQYLNISGFDVLKFVSAIVNLTQIVDKVRSDELNMDTLNSVNNLTEHKGVAEERNDDAAVILVNEISRVENNMPTPTNMLTTQPAEPQIFDETISTATTNFNETKSQEEGQLNGLHGLVDSVLEILPQDQILATFFDKLETDENFRKFVNNIQRPAFAQVLSKLEQSMILRNLIFTLHNNGIYITRIVDSLKAYFFLGGFS